MNITGKWSRPTCVAPLVSFSLLILVLLVRPRRV